MLKGYFDVSPKSTNTVGSANVSGTRFQNISNPYSEMPRTQTPWDRLLNWFGFRSGYDKAQEHYNLAGAEYNSQLEQLASEEAYNSPAQQAARMRSAGLNPDLTGVSGEPASEFDNQQTPPDISAGTDVNPIDVIGNVASGFLSTISGTIGILSDVNLLNQARIATGTKDLEFAGKMLQFFKDSDSFFRSQDEDTEGNVVTTLLGKNSPLFHSSRSIKRFNQVRNSAENSLMGLTARYKSYDDFAKQASDFGKTLSQPYISGFGSLSAKEIADFLKPLSKAQYDLTMAEIKASNASAYKTYHKEAVEGDAYAKLDSPQSGYSDDLARSIQEGTKADIAESGARLSLAPLEVTKNRIYEKMYRTISNIPDKSLGSTILKFFLMNQLSQGFNPLKTASNLAGVVSKL